MIKKIAVFFCFLVLFSIEINAQEKVLVDKIIAIVGSSVILQSDVENQYLQAISQKTRVEKCDIFENLLIQKLMVNQAKVDSVLITDAQVEMQLESRLKYFIDQAGSKEKLEAYFNKSMFQIKEDMRLAMREQLITQKMQGEITSDIKITPTEVTNYYKNLSEDSISLVNAQVEYKQICIYPTYTDKSIFEIKQKLLGLRKRVLDGEKFSTLALLYSEDAASARTGGEIGFMNKGGLDPAYAKAAWNLKENAVSNIVESEFGYHIIQLIAKDGDKANTRHILLKPKANDTEIKNTLIRLDSILTAIKKDSLKFERAVGLFSEDKNSRFNEGNVVNGQTNSTKFELDQLSQEDYYVIKKMNVGDISEPFPSKDDTKKDVFKIIKLISRSNPHKANLKNDYQFIQEQATENKKQKVIANWIIEKQKTTFIKIDDSYKDCPFKYNIWIKENQK